MPAASRRDRTSLQRAGRTCLPPLRQVVCVASCATEDGQPSLAARWVAAGLAGGGDCPEWSRRKEMRFDRCRSDTRRHAAGDGAYRDHSACRRRQVGGCS